eukprot:3873604-Amphidinium_carterae.1
MPQLCTISCHVVKGGKKGTVSPTTTIFMNCRDMCVLNRGKACVQRASWKQNLWRRNPLCFVHSNICQELCVVKRETQRHLWVFATYQD